MKSIYLGVEFSFNDELNSRLLLGESNISFSKVEKETDRKYAAVSVSKSDQS